MSLDIEKLLNARYSGTAGEDAPVRMDASTSALLTMDYVHHEIHGGSAFTVCVSNTTANTDDHRTLLGFETPAGLKAPHLVIAVSVSNPAELFLYEGVTIDDDEGTELTIKDRNRVTANTSTVIPFTAVGTPGSATWMLESEVAGATFSATTTLCNIVLSSGSGPQAVGGVSRATQEWVLAPSTKYAIVVQNIGQNINRHTIELDWYEHQPHN